MLPIKKMFFALLSLTILTIVFFQIRTIGDFQIDDTYITFSFSKNLALGNGPIYSHGLRVEGYSNFLWMLLLSIPIKIWPQADIYFLARMMMIPFVGLLFYATFSLARSLTSFFFACGAVLLLALSSDIFSAAMVALETIPYTALLIMAFCVYLKNQKDNRVMPIMTLAALTRIDGFIPMLLLCGFEFVRRIQSRDFKWKEFLAWSAPSLLAYSLWFLWRWSYYGLLFPTTYYAKSHISTVFPTRGYDYAVDTFKSCAGIVLLPLGAYFILRKPSAKSLWLGLFCIFHTLYVIHVGGDWMPFDRFFIPLFPILITLFISSLGEVSGQTKNLPLVFRLPMYVLCLMAFIFVGTWMTRFSINTPQEYGKIGLSENQTHHVKDNLIPAARLFAWAIKPGEKLVSDYAGAFAVFTDAQVIDMWGLCNKEIALKGTTAGVNPIYGLTCPPCLAAEKPDYFHTMVPLLKPISAFNDHATVIRNVWQSDQVSRYMNMPQEYATGRVIDQNTGRAFYFLERRRPEKDFKTRHPAPHITIEYPFETAQVSDNAPSN